MSSIKILDELTTNQIAAGEVVETPASVVKELVENALDAAGKYIYVYISGGGLEKIHITDNGEGIPAGEVELAFQRHATSKIYCADDLYTIATLGFRGEALPSIASVSRLECTTRASGETTGTRLCLEGGKIVSQEETGCAPGTEIIVNNLFYNTPARRRFLQSASAEAARISYLLSRFALVNAYVSFTLTSEGRKILETNGDGELLASISGIYGRDCANRMLSVSASNEDYQLRGYISDSSWSKPNRRYQTFAVNGRFVQSRLLQEALEEGYHSILAKGRFPAAVLYLQLSPRLIDVNVHPAKTEVRFSQEKELYSFVKNAVRETLRYKMGFASFNTGSTVEQSTANILPGKQEKIAWEKSGEYSLRSPNIAEELSFIDRTKVAQKTEAVQRDSHDKREELMAPVDSEPISTLPPVKIIGQLFQTYILAEGEREFYLIDQHAAHERILFEEFRSYYQDNTGISVQEILPVRLEFSLPGVEELRDKSDYLNSLGLRIEHFGNNTFIIRGIPFFIKDVFQTEYLRDFLETILHKLQKPDTLLREEIVVTMACKAAVKANQHLTIAEMRSLLSRLRKVETPFTCPHGRPTLLTYNSNVLEKKFKRTGSH